MVILPKYVHFYIFGTFSPNLFTGKLTI